MSACAKTPWGDMPLSDSRTMPVERAPHGVDDDALRVAGVVFPAPGEGASRPSSGAAYIGVDLGSGDYSAISLVLSDAVLLSLRLSAAEAGLSEEQLISNLVAQHAAKIGIARLSEFQQGGEAVSRVAHNHDVAGSNPAPATTDNSSRSEHGEGGNRAAPARGAGPP
uniref:Transcriptional repressor n=1 Tax=Mesorhizobium phage vB_MseS-P1 TaxID=3120101 RepID=A0AB38ZLI2_9VIRU